MKKYVLIVAGGQGTRMGASLPKQFLEVAKEPILMHTLRRFWQWDENAEIILVLPAAHQDYWHTLQAKYQFQIPHVVVNGGETRTDSVRQGLAYIQEEESLVAIHDGVRPCVALSTIAESFQVAAQKGSAITAVRLKDSIREMLPSGHTEARDRSRYFLMQTPQTFQTKLIKAAYAQLKSTAMTDDASVAEHHGIAVHLIEGSYQNIKATTPEDLFLLEYLLQSNSPFRL
ncbi:MAG: 2-C-methyl-D-erythritol 4-phosphate cytidylyltransferase [Microscillaceae bacterium]|nr:2-C-methyl-D-erythritol 4-phosphate cytidylyltransferase [Microscillaceae bacterium]